MLNEKIENLGIIGYPIGHSLSPLMQNAAINEAGLSYRYTAMPVHPEDLQSAILGLKALHFRGFNVTIPHKVNIIPFLDQIDEDAKMIGAVNTVSIEDGRLLGYNTDFCGFIADLENHDFTVERKHAVLLGAGGSARAVLWGLISGGVKSLTVGVRSIERANSVVSIFKSLIDIDVFHWEDPNFQMRLQDADLLINTTPLGMSPNFDQVPPVNWIFVRQNAFVCDLIYNPASTKFLELAKKNGNRTMNGMGMLVEQGAASLKIWSGISVSTKVMMEVLRVSLK